jgi:hypothetical protein
MPDDAHEAKEQDIGFFFAEVRERTPLPIHAKVVFSETSNSYRVVVTVHGAKGRPVVSFFIKDDGGIDAQHDREIIPGIGNLYGDDVMSRDQTIRRAVSVIQRAAKEMR